MGDTTIRFGENDCGQAKQGTKVSVHIDYIFLLFMYYYYFLLFDMIDCVGHDTDKI